METRWGGLWGWRSTRAAPCWWRTTSATRSGGWPRTDIRRRSFHPADAAAAGGPRPRQPGDPAPAGVPSAGWRGLDAGLGLGSPALLRDGPGFPAGTVR